MSNDLVIRNGFVSRDASTLIGSVSATSNVARSLTISPTLVATGNNNTLIGLDIAPTFNNGAFTGVTNLGIRISGNTSVSGLLYNGVTGITDNLSPVHSTGPNSLVWTASLADQYVAGFINNHPSFGNGVIIRGGADKNDTRRLLQIENNDGTQILSVRGSGNVNVQTQIRVGSVQPTVINNSSISINAASTIQHVISTGMVFSTFNAPNAVTIRQDSANVLIGTTTDAGFRLDVNGITRVGSTGTSQFNVTNPSFGNGRLRISVSDNFSFSLLDNDGYGFIHNTSQTGINSRSGRIFLWTQADNTTTLQLGGQDINPTVARTRTVIQPVQSNSTLFSPTSGIHTDYLFRTENNAVFSPTGGSTTYTFLQVSPAVNATGSYNGLVRGIFYNPTLTSLSGVTHRAIETTTGDVLFGTTSGKLFVGSTVDTAAQDNLINLSVGSSGGATSLIRFQRFPGSNSSYEFGVSSGSFGLRELRDSNMFFSVRNNITANELKRIEFGALNGTHNANVFVYNSSPATNTYPLTVMNSRTDANSNAGVGFGSVDLIGNEQRYAAITGIKTSTWVGGANTPSGGIGFMVTNGSTALTESMRITPSQNVLIGTTTDAGFRLDVNGETRFNNNIVLVNPNFLYLTLDRTSYIRAPGTNLIEIGVTGGTNTFMSFAPNIIRFGPSASANLNYNTSFATLGLNQSAVSNQQFTISDNGSATMFVLSKRTSNTSNYFQVFDNTANVIQGGFSSIGGGFFGTSALTSTAILEANSTTRGFLMPRMTTTNWDAIANKAQGLEGFDTTVQKPMYVATTGTPVTEWVSSNIFTQTNTVTISNTTSELTTLGTGVGTKTLPANFFTIGKTIRLTIKGYMNETGTPTIRVRLKLGTTTIFDTNAVTINTLGGTNKYFDAYYDITCRTTGVSGTVFPQGRWLYTANNGATYVIDGAVTTTSTIDTTTSQVLDLTVQWGAANVNNNVNITNATIEIIN